MNNTSPTRNIIIKQEQRYARNQRLARIGCGLFLLSCLLCTCSLATVVISLPHVGGGTGTTPDSSSPLSAKVLSSLSIELYGPATLRMGNPATFTLSLVNLKSSPANTGTANPSPIFGAPIPNGTPDAPLSRAFGPGYEVHAYGQLDVSPASKFDLPQQLRQDPQSLDQQILTFSWTITPKEALPIAVISLTMVGQWIFIGGKGVPPGSDMSIPLWQYSQSYEVAQAEVAQPSSPVVSVQSVTFVLGLLGSIGSALTATGITIPWVWDRIQGRRKARKQKQES